VERRIHYSAKYFSRDSGQGKGMGGCIARAGGYTVFEGEGPWNQPGKKGGAKSNRLGGVGRILGGEKKTVGLIKLKEVPFFIMGLSDQILIFAVRRGGKLGIIRGSFCGGKIVGREKQRTKRWLGKGEGEGKGFSRLKRGRPRRGDHM